MDKKTKSPKRKKADNYVLIVLCFIFITVISFCSSFWYSHKQQIQAAEQEADNKLAGINEYTFKMVTPTIIYDKNDRQIAKLSPADYIYTKYSDIPELVKEAFIATEDKDFFKNNGVSIRGMGRALVSYIKNKGKITQGGSTITQQLVKNVFLTQDRTWSRKYSEILMSLQLEKQYSKEQILEYYLNNINFSNGAYSIASAAHIYFNKPLSDLNLAEIAFLSAIPNNPTYYNPLKYYDHVIDRQSLILYNLKAQNYITDKQYNEAVNAKVLLNYQPYKSESENYMVSYAIDSAVRALMENDNFDFKYSFASEQERKDYDNTLSDIYTDYDKKVRSGGYNIYTSLDVGKQQQLQASLDDGLSDFKEIDSKTGLYKMQGAAVCIDNATGEVNAAVGGRSQRDTVNYFNRAFLAVRQPGSAIKPVLVYTPAFDEDFTPEDTMVDQYIPNGPKNAEGTFFGQVTLRYATELSLNTVAYQLLQKEGIQHGLSYLAKMDFAHIVRQDDNPIAAIGGFTRGVTPVELAGAYSTLARGGQFIAPTCVRKIEGGNGEPIYENLHIKTRVYKAESAYYMTDVLKGVLTKSWATGYGLGLFNMPAAGKTGTTSASKDGWFAGYTTYMTTVVWTGYDIPTAIPSLYGATYPGHIWQDFMNKVHAGLPMKDFDIPQTVKQEMKAKAEAEVQAAQDKAEEAVTAYEGIQIHSKDDYAAAVTALQNAQNAVTKVPGDNKQAFEDRINAKSEELTKEKEAIQQVNPSTTPQTKTDESTPTVDNNNGNNTNENTTDNNNVNSTNNDNNDETNNENNNTLENVPNQQDNTKENVPNQQDNTNSGVPVQNEKK